RSGRGRRRPRIARDMLHCASLPDAARVMVGGVCGRYVMTRSADDLLAEFEAADVLDGEPLVADYNVAPTDTVPVVLTRPRPAGSPGWSCGPSGLRSATSTTTAPS